MARLKSMNLPPKQEKHLTDIMVETTFRLDTKYRRGYARHKGNLLKMSKKQLLEEAINEAIDQLVYLLTLKSKI